MTDLLAYALREEFAGTVVQYETQEDADNGNGVEVPAYTGGVISAGDRDVNVRELLDEKPEGVIVVHPSDVALINALEDYPALKRVSAAGLDLPADVQPVDELESSTVAHLRDLAEREGLAGASTARKAELVAAIRAKRDAVAEAATGSEEDKLRASELDHVDEAADADQEK